LTAGSCCLAKRAAQRYDQGVLLVDAPGVVRGVAGAELLTGLVEAAAIAVVLVLVGKAGQTPLANELNSLPATVYRVEAAAAARPPGKRQRSRAHRELWDLYLSRAVERTIELAELGVIGTSPPLSGHKTNGKAGRLPSWPDNAPWLSARCWKSGARCCRFACQPFPKGAISC